MVRRLVDVVLGLLHMKLVHEDWLNKQQMKAAQWDGLWATPPQKPMQRTWN